MKLLNLKFVVLVLVLTVFIISVLGGALGVAFGFGFLASPLPVISLAAEPAFHLPIGSFPVYNTTIMLIISGIVLIFLAWRATRNISEVPTGLQNVFEAIYEFFRKMAKEMGGENAYKFLPVVVIIFFVVLASNWLGILPGVGTFGRVETIKEWVDLHAEDELKILMDTGKVDGLSEEDQNLVAELEVLILNQNERFVVFGGQGFFAPIPFGRSEESKAPLSSIVPVNPRDLEEIVETVEHGDALTARQSEILDEARTYVSAGAVQQPFQSVKGVQYDCSGGKSDGEPNCLEKNPAGVLIPFLRGASTDLNTTLSLALIAMVSVQLFGIRALGFFGYAGKFLNFKGGPAGIFVGILELFAEIARVISFTFRLFGNLFAGEILLIAIGFLLPLVGIIPFLGLELFVGVIQAFIFAALTLVFSVMASQPHGGDEHH